MLNFPDFLPPLSAGIGLRTPHFKEVLQKRPDLGWVEVHSENFFSQGGKPPFILEEVRKDYPVSFHGVGLSLGSTDPLSSQHLEKIKALVNTFNPILVSDHLCWSAVNHKYLNDLLPLPYTKETLNLVIDKVNQVQDALGRRFLLENASTYLQFKASNIKEEDFIVELVDKTDCGILLDVNNLYVNQQNHQWDLDAYLNTIPSDIVYEIHLAGYETTEHMLIDTHGYPVSNPVWELYTKTIQKMGRKPTLIEWDTDIPALEVLLAEKAKADTIMDEIYVIV